MSDRGVAGGGPDEQLEAALRRAARALPYPPAPPIQRLLPPAAAGRRIPRWAVSLAVVGLALLTLLAVPAVRAGLVEFLQIGAVRILLGPTAAPAPALTPVPSLLDLYGQTTLADARRLVSFPIPLPAYPADLGAPDEVFLQFFDAPAVILVWFDRAEPGRVRLALHLLSAGGFAEKRQPPALRAAAVNGAPAVWTAGPYLLQLRNGRYDAQHLVTGHVLVWTVGDLTYRLESDLPLDEAIKTAESLP